MTRLIGNDKSKIVDNELKTAGRDDVSVSMQHAENSQKKLETIAEFQKL